MSIGGNWERFREQPRWVQVTAGGLLGTALLFGTAAAAASGDAGAHRSETALDLTTTSEAPTTVPTTEAPVVTTTTAPPTTVAPTTAPPPPPPTAPPTTAAPVVVTPPPPPPAPPAPSCTPGYSPCIPPGSDVDCAGGSGDG